MFPHSVHVVLNVFRVFCFVGLGSIVTVFLQFWPSGFGVFEHVWVLFEPLHHVVEVFGSFVFSFLEWVIS